MPASRRGPIRSRRKGTRHVRGHRRCRLHRIESARRARGAPRGAAGDGDRLRSNDKWRNIAKREISDIVHPDQLFDFLDANTGRITAIFHMGAISSTTETDADLIVDNNFNLSVALLAWCARNDVRFIYASSAATYGDGAPASTTIRAPRRWRACGRSTPMAGASICSTAAWRASWPRASRCRRNGPD